MKPGLASSPGPKFTGGPGDTARVLARMRWPLPRKVVIVCYFGNHSVYSSDFGVSRWRILLSSEKQYRILYGVFTFKALRSRLSRRKLFSVCTVAKMCSPGFQLGTRCQFYSVEITSTELHFACGAVVLFSLKSNMNGRSW